MANFCNSCGTAVATGTIYCGNCGASVAPPPPPQAAPYAPPPHPAYAPPPPQPAPYAAPPYYAPPAPSGNNLPWIIAGGIVLLLAVAVAYLFLTRGQSGDGAAGAGVGGVAAVGTPAETPAVGAEVLKYVSSNANIRNIATAAGTGSQVVGTLRRGQQVRGTMHQGLSGDSYWFKLADGRGYVSAVNLSDGPPGPETLATAAVRAPLANGTYCSVVTSSGNLRIRATPGGGILGGMPRGSRFQAFDQQVDRAGYTWVHIQPIDGRYPVGWVLSSYISC